MSRRRLVAVAATAAAVGVASFGGYRITKRRQQRAAQPIGPHGPGVARGGGRRKARRDRDPPADELFDMPSDVTHRSVPTPDGGSLHVMERGDGRPLMLLHGITLSAEVWAPQFNQLADRYRVIAVDLRGHGQSTAGRDGYGLPRLATDVATVLEALDLDDAVLVGHSMGGMTVMQFCDDHADVLSRRVAGVVFVATRAHAVVPPLLAGMARQLGVAGQARLDAGRKLPESTRLSRRMSRVAFGERPSPKAVAIVAEMTTSLPPEAFLPSTMGLLDHDARDALTRTDTPAMVVVGSRDLLTPVSASRQLAHLLNDCELHVLPGAGHQLMQERPDELAALLDDFVRRLPAMTRAMQAAAD